MQGSLPVNVLYIINQPFYSYNPTKQVELIFLFDQNYNVDKEMEA